MLLAIIAQPENLEDLSCVTLQDGSAGQDYHSLGVVFLDSLRGRLTKLKSLSLSKLADLGSQDATTLPWEWDIENDRNVLQDWMGCLQDVSETLVTLSFEDCFVSDKHFEDCIESAKQLRIMVNVEGESSDSEDSEWSNRGAGSSRRFREIVLPALAKQSWPKLEHLSFAGLHVGLRALDEAGVLDNIGPKVEIDIFPGQIVAYHYDATPIYMSPPEDALTDPLDAEDLGFRLRKIKFSEQEGKMTMKVAKESGESSQRVR